jgi:thiol-disulfide isomerase/thioredoxin
MTDAPTSPPRQLAGYLALGLALLVAVGAGAYYFLLAGDDAERAAPARPAAFPGTGPLDSQRPEIGRPAPNFALVDARDTTVIRQLTDFRGQVIMLNWYASWCEPCLREIPAFLRARDALAGQMEVVGVNYLEPPARAVGILDHLGADFPAVLDADGSVAAHYRIPGMPTTFLIGADGTLLAMRAGEIHERDLPAFLAKAGLTYTVE